jgi:hypothetical protein
MPIFLSKRIVASRQTRRGIDGPWDLRVGAGAGRRALCYNSFEHGVCIKILYFERIAFTTSRRWMTKYGSIGIV